MSFNRAPLPWQQAINGYRNYLAPLAQPPAPPQYLGPPVAQPPIVEQQPPAQPPPVYALPNPGTGQSAPSAPPYAGGYGNPQLSGYLNQFSGQGYAPMTPWQTVFAGGAKTAGQGGSGTGGTYGTGGTGGTGTGGVQDAYNFSWGGPNSALPSSQYSYGDASGTWGYAPGGRMWSGTPAHVNYGGATYNPTTGAWSSNGQAPSTQSTAWAGQGGGSGTNGSTYSLPNPGTNGAGNTGAPSSASSNPNYDTYKNVPGFLGFSAGGAAYGQNQDGLYWTNTPEHVNYSGQKFSPQSGWLGGGQVAASTQSKVWG